MDKKQTLTPELKQIYERVMNTPLPASAATPSTPPPSTSQATVLTSPVSPVVPPAPILHTMPTHIVTPPSAAPQPSMAVTHAVTANPMITVHPAVAPAPGASSSKTFVFTGSAATTSAPSAPINPHATQHSGTVVAKKGGGINPKIMVFAGITFFIFYAAFWLKVLGYIQL